MLYFIKAAGPDSVLKGHRTRKVATSINYFQHMDFESLTRYTGWKSQKVFMKCYFQNLDALKFHAVAAGKSTLFPQKVSYLTNMYFLGYLR